LKYLGISSNAIQNNGSKSRDQFVSTEFCHSQYKLIPVNLRINSCPPNLITCNINQIVSAEFYHLQYNLIRIKICLHKRGNCKQVVADPVVHSLRLSYERTLRTQNTSRNHSPGCDNQYNENFHNSIGTCIFPQPIYLRPG